MQDHTFDPGFLGRLTILSNLFADTKSVLEERDNESLVGISKTCGAKYIASSSAVKPGWILSDFGGAIISNCTSTRYKIVRLKNKTNRTNYKFIANKISANVTSVDIYWSNEYYKKKAYNSLVLLPHNLIMLSVYRYWNNSENILLEESFLQ